MLCRFEFLTLEGWHEIRSVDRRWLGSKSSPKGDAVGQRFVVGLKEGTDWVEVREELLRLGAGSVNEPSPAQPDVLVAAIPSDRDADDFLNRAKALKGVRYAEPEAWQSTY